MARCRPARSKRKVTGFRNVQRSIAKRQCISMGRAGKILGAATRRNPKLRKSGPPPPASAPPASASLWLEEGALAAWEQRYAAASIALATASTVSAKVCTACRAPCSPQLAT